MSYFGNALRELLERKGMKAVRLAEISTVSQPTVSRYISGDQVWVSPEDLCQIARAISDDPREQAELVRARLLDEKQGPGAELVTVQIAAPGESPATAPAYAIRLPSDLEEAFNVLRENVVSDPAVREIVVSLADLLAPGRGTKSDQTSSAERLQKSEARGKDIVDILRAGRKKRSRQAR